MKRKICCLALVLICVFTYSTPSFASTEKPLVNNDVDATETSNTDNPEAKVRPRLTKWTIESSEYVGLVNVGDSVYYDKERASAAGEKITVTVKRSLSGGIKGELKVTKEVLTARLGFDYSTTFTVSKSKTSRALKKNEWVYTHYQKRNKKYKVVQKGTKKGMKTAHKTVYVYKPFTPQVTMTYKK